MKVCVSCGRWDADRPMVKTPTLSPDVSVCVSCFDTYQRRSVDGVRQQIANDVDRMMAHTQEYRDYLFRIAAEQSNPKCGHCGAKVVVYPMGRVPLWCMACERQRGQLEERARA